MLTGITAATLIYVDANFHVIFLWTGIEGEPTNKSNFTLKKPSCDIEEHSHFTRTASVQCVSLDSIVLLVFLNSRQLHVFAFISSIMFTIPIRTFCNLI